MFLAWTFPMLNLTLVFANFSVELNGIGWCQHKIFGQKDQKSWTSESTTRISILCKLKMEIRSVLWIRKSRFVGEKNHICFLFFNKIRKSPFLEEEVHLWDKFIFLASIKNHLNFWLLLLNFKICYFVTKKIFLKN